MEDDPQRNVHDVFWVGVPFRPTLVEPVYDLPAARDRIQNQFDVLPNVNKGVSQDLVATYTVSKASFVLVFRSGEEGANSSPSPAVDGH